MKKILLTASAALTILFAQAQTLCDPNMTYTIGSQYQLEIAIPVTGNSLPTMAPLYAVTYGDGNMLAEDSCFSGPCTHMVLNYNPNGAYYDTLTTCISYTLTDTVGYVDTLMCCFSQYWDGSSWTVTGGTPTPSWDCAPNTILGCADPGNGNGQYTSLSACQLVCGAPCPGLASIAQNTNIFTANITGGIAPYTYLWSTGETTQAISVSLSTSGYCDITDANGCVYSATYSYSAGQLVACDSITVSGSQTQFTMQVNNFNSIIYYWISTAPDGTVLGEDSMWNSHLVYNSFTIPNDTITTCITYANGANTLTCCVEFFWNGSFWAKMGSVTSIGEIDLFDKKIIKVVDVLGRETSINSDQTLFFIYEDGTVEKRYIINKK